MAFSPHASFAPLLASLNIPQSNDSPVNKRLFNKQTIVLRDHTLLSTNFKPNRSKNQSFILTDDDIGHEAPVKGRILKHVLREIGDPWECLNLIDATQRLGIDYHFQQEIEAILQRQYVLFNAVQLNSDTDLHKTAFLFRLFRQHGYLVSSDVFESFLDGEGKFKEELKDDIKGLMSLYEASQLCMHGDEILEEAENFSSHWLKARAEAEQVDHHLASFVQHTLAYPHHKSVVQLMAPNYLEDVQWPNKWISIFRDAAKMELYSAQRLRQHELAQFTKWWKETDLAKDLSFSRDQPIKWYVASLICLSTDSFYSEQRIQLAKSISFIYLIDDIFDVFGTLDELTIFTEAVCRWDLAAAEGLPDCMQICLRTLFEVTNEISCQIYQAHGWNPIHSLHKAWAKLCKAFLVEAEWMSSGQSPSAEEYLKNGVVSTGVHVTLTHVFFLLGELISKETVELFDEDLDIISSSATVLRLWDDMGSAKDEKQEGRDGSYLEYYMKEHPSMCYEETKRHTMKQICNAWKTLNTECLLSNLFPAKFNQACLNLARVVPIAYNYGRAQSIMSLENLIKQFLFHQMELEPIKDFFIHPMAASASAMLIVGVIAPPPPPPSSSSSSSSSFQPYPKASMHNMVPHSKKWTIPLHHSFLPISLPADSQISPSIDETSMKYEFEMKNLKHLLRETAKIDSLESLNMIDAIQRLGIDHCFKQEIKAILQTQYTMETHNFDAKCGLHQVALRFRLLRQHGYFVPQDVFEGFIDHNHEGLLDTKFSENIEGLTSLYEASQLCLPEDEKLEKIGNFSARILKKLVRNRDDNLSKHVRKAMANPFHKSLVKFVVKDYFGSQSPNKWIYVFQHMAKLDFNRVQKLHGLELSQFIMWWKKTGLCEELKFARDQPLKWYICSMAFLADPMFSEERVELTKCISFIYLIDDIYDVYGSLEELRLFTKAIQRWDLAALDGLPNPMKFCIIKLHETTNEICHKFYLKHGWNPINSLRKSWVRLCEAFLVEAEWFGSSHLPSAKEYLENGEVSSGVHVVLAHIFFLLGQGVSNEAVLLSSNPDIVSSTASILRLSDDLGSAKDENQEGHDGSYIECYMKENPGISVDSARKRISHVISDAWKRLNQESLFSPNPYPPTFIQASLNIARFVPLLYGYDENQDLPTLEKLVKFVLYESIGV
ncbi:uncharacterized protein LOC111434068 [Cucurbita moschata]|uniref:Uncharacterized protein LOC111434068 n=1 Tax=Cucurbita moschata TaxID=3662 RepID=A0A6J1EH51_CUCMO|nr:uncharacterized protein LOC111434068 [Cucurbita moschata]